MRKHSLPFLLVAVLMLVGVVLTGCQNAGTTATSAPAAASTAPTTTTEASASAAATDSAAAAPSAAAALDDYTFTYYFNYDWWDIVKIKWDNNEIGKYYQKTLHITPDFQKPDSDAAAKLNLMISSGDLPDAIMMDRGVDNVKMARLNLFVPLDPFMANNKALEENVMPNTVKQLQIDGKLYGVPNWSRKGPSGGNDCWIYNLRIYKACGSPKLETLDDLYNYAKAAKQLGKNKEGLDIVPFTIDQTTDGGNNIGRAFYRSMGGYMGGGSWYASVNKKFELIFRDPVFKAATMEGNKWWRDGLINTTQFSDTGDQITEKIVAGRVALMFYDHSKNETTQYRNILKKTFPDDSEEIASPFPFPPANGLPTSKIYADNQPTIGWNVTCITTKAKQPERIFGLLSQMLTKEGSIIMMYGPKGFNWDTLDDKGNPVLKTPEAMQTPEEKDKLGCWFYAIPGQSDNVDTTKFAVNDMQPADKQNWVVSSQAHIFTPIMWCSDEFNSIDLSVDPQSTDGINRKLCEDTIVAQYPKILMAGTADEANKLYDDLIAFCDQHGMPAVEAAYDKKYQENVAAVGTGMNK